MRNRYEPARGVLPVEWHQGSPDSGFYIVLVEVWSSSIELFNNFPLARVMAIGEVWVRAGNEWKAVDHNGELRTVANGEVRRWARIPGPRWWYGNVVLDGWR